MLENRTHGSMPNRGAVGTAPVKARTETECLAALLAYGYVTTSIVGRTCDLARGVTDLVSRHHAITTGGAGAVDDHARLVQGLA